MTRSTQSLERGLSILEALNRQPGLTANQVSRLTGLTRGTAFRTLETLRNLDYLRRDTHDGSYWLERRVCALADGFNEDAWIETIARPRLATLSAEIVWPLTVSTPSGVSMLVRINTDFQSPLSKHRFPIGHRISLVSSASGKAYLAYCSQKHRSLLLDLIAQSSPREEDKIARDAQAMREMLNRVREDGFAALVAGDRSAIAVPILSRQQPFACLAVRYFTSALRLSQAKREILPLIVKAADDIGKFFTTQVPTPAHPES